MASDLAVLISAMVELSSFVQLKIDYSLLEDVRIVHHLTGSISCFADNLFSIAMQEDIGDH